MSADASTALNPATVGGGDSLDETLVTQADLTAVKRVRADMGFASTDGRGRLVDDDNHALPTTDERAAIALERIAADVSVMRHLMEKALS